MITYFRQTSLKTGNTDMQNIKLFRCVHHQRSAYRPLPPGLQPLQEICYSKMSKMIAYSCKKGLNAIFDLDKNKSTMRQFLLQLPGTVRDKLLEKLSGGYIYGTYPCHLYLDEALFSTGMRKLVFDVGCDCRQIHFENFLALASAEGNALRTLIFDYSTLEGVRVHVTPNIYQQIGDILASAEHLVDLRLSWIGDDVIMKLIGENCIRLKNLELSPSGVTTKGFHYLTQNFVKHPTETEEGKRVWESKLWGFPGIFPPLEELLPEGEPLKFYERKKSPLCSTLTSINIDCFCDSTYEAILAVMELIESLESIGMLECVLSDLFKKWYKAKKINHFVPSLFNITSINVDTMEESIFDMIITMFPKLRHITYNYFEPNTPSTFSLNSFNHFKFIESVNINHETSTLQTENFGDLSEEVRGKLTEIIIENPRAAKPFDISGVQLCSSLRRLDLYFSTIVWSGSSNGDLIAPHDTMQNLASVELQGNVTGKAVLSLLECAPNLEYLTVSDIIERKDDFLHRLLEVREMPKLETFEVLEGFLLDTEDELRAFVTHFERIRHVGKILFL